MFLAWGLALYQYGDAYAQGHVVFYMVITVIGGIFCLMHLRSAALLLTGVTVIPFSIFFLATGHPVFIAIAINTMLVSAVMVYVTWALKSASRIAGISSTGCRVTPLAKMLTARPSSGIGGPRRERL